MAKKKSKALAIDEIVKSASFSKWCIVNTENEFSLSPKWSYIIDSSVNQYAVLNKPSLKNGTMNDWTNQALMTKILVIDTNNEMRFFDENLSEISHDKIKIKVTN